MANSASEITLDSGLVYPGEQAGKPDLIPDPPNGRPGSARLNLLQTGWPWAVDHPVEHPGSPKLLREFGLRLLGLASEMTGENLAVTQDMVCGDTVEALNLRGGRHIFVLWVQRRFQLVADGSAPAPAISASN